MFLAFPTARRRNRLWHVYLYMYLHTYMDIYVYIQVFDIGKRQHNVQASELRLMLKYSAESTLILGLVVLLFMSVLCCCLSLHYNSYIFRRKPFSLRFRGAGLLRFRA